MLAQQERQVEATLRTNPASVGPDASVLWREKTIETTGVEYYDKGVRLAFNHGIPDGQSTAAVADLRVVGMTRKPIRSAV